MDESGFSVLQNTCPYCGVMRTDTARGDACPSCRDALEKIMAGVHLALTGLRQAYGERPMMSVGMVEVPDVDTRGLDTRPHKRLAAAVLEKALEDAARGFRLRRTAATTGRSDKSLRALREFHTKVDGEIIDARAWLCGTSLGLWLWCAWLGVHPDRVNAMAREKDWCAQRPKAWPAPVEEVDGTTLA